MYLRMSFIVMMWCLFIGPSYKAPLNVIPRSYYDVNTNTVVLTVSEYSLAYLKNLLLYKVEEFSAKRKHNISVF